MSLKRMFERMLQLLRRLMQMLAVAMGVMAAGCASYEAANTMLLEPASHFDDALVHKAEATCAAHQACKTVVPARFPKVSSLESPTVGFVVTSEGSRTEKAKLMADLKQALSDSPRPMMLTVPAHEQK